MAAALKVAALTSGCQEGGDASPTEPGSTVLFAFASAIDPAVPWSPSAVDEAVAQGFARWEGAGSGARFFHQGSSDLAVIEDDGLQVVWIWWQAEGWPYDPAAWLGVTTWERRGATGFDLVLQAPVCPGAGTDEAAAGVAIANAVARGVGEALGIVPDADPDSPLAAGACTPGEALAPSAAEEAALRGLYPP